MQLALSLLIAATQFLTMIQSTPNLPPSVKEQGLTVAYNAIAFAQKTINEKPNLPPTAPIITQPVAPAITPSIIIPESPTPSSIIFADKDYLENHIWEGGNCSTFTFRPIVRDQNGGGMVGVTVEFTNPETGERLSSVTERSSASAYFVYKPLSANTTQTITFTAGNVAGSLQIQLGPARFENKTLEDITRYFESDGVRDDPLRAYTEKTCK